MAYKQEAHQADLKEAIESVPTTREGFAQALGLNTVLHVERLVEDSVKSIVQRKAYFRERDIVKGALRLAQKRVDEATLEKRLFYDLVDFTASQYPLVVIGETGYLSTHEMWGMEKIVLEILMRKDVSLIQPKDVFDWAIAQKVGISEEQIDAVIAGALSDDLVTIIEGYAGAGKSFTMEALNLIYRHQGYIIKGTALGWNASKVLSASANIPDEDCVAIEGFTRQLLSRMEHGMDPFDGDTLIIVDEAGMVGTRHMSILFKAAAMSKFKIKMILTGDSLQVIPVDAGAIMETCVAWKGSTIIETIRRQFQPSLRKMVYRFSQKQSGHAVNTLHQQECFRWCRDNDMVLNRVTQDYVSYRMAFPQDSALVLAYANKDVLELNYRIRQAYRKLGLIGQEDITLKVTDGRETFEAQFSVGDSVLLRANNKDMVVYEIDENKSPYRPKTWKPIRLGVFNRNPGRIVAIQKSKDPLGSYDFTIDIQGETPGRIIINSEKFGRSDFSATSGFPMVHNYAGTIYGSQGQTVSQVFMLDHERLDFRLAYVGLSRNKKRTIVYLNETDLTRRLDNVSQKRMSLQDRLEMERQGKSMADAHVELGRYKRSEMLKLVALTYGKHSENLTCHMMERQKRIPESQLAREAEKAATVEAASLTETIIDFIPEYNVPYPLVDMAQLLSLPDPLIESELVRPSDVEENKKRYKSSELPLDIDATPIPQDPRKVERVRENIGVLPKEKHEDKGFFHTVAGIIAPPQQEGPAPPRKDAQLRHFEPSNPFADVELPPEEEKEETLTGAVLKRLNAWLNPKPLVSVPFVEKTGLCGSVIYPPSDPDYEKARREESLPDDRPHYISFEGVPSVLNMEGGPDEEWVSKKRFDMWDIGEFGEPRAIARAANGQVAARYRFDGTCVVGEGFPPICVNRAGSAETPVYIVAGAKEWFWLRQTMEEKYGLESDKMPHCIWGAKDVDWKFFAPNLKKTSRVVIVRSKQDDRQIPWAQDLEKMLTELGVDAVVSPPIPKASLDTADTVNTADGSEEQVSRRSPSP